MARPMFGIRFWNGNRESGCNPYVLHDECPHMRVPLSGGRLQGTVLECPRHGGKVDVRDGAVVERPIRKRATCFAVRESAAGLEVGLPASG